MNTGKLNILIVEDEEAHIEALRRVFEISGVDVNIRVANKLCIYREMAAKEKPDIALVDLNLPDGCATSVLSHTPDKGTFPIIIMTSHGDEYVAVNAIKSGAVDYIVKSPQAFADIPRTVERNIREWNLLQKHKQAEKALIASEARYRMLTETMNDAIIMTNEDCDITFVNPAASWMLGMESIDMIGRKFADFVDKDSQAVLSEHLEKRKQGLSSQYELTLIRSDGSLVYSLVNGHPVFDVNGKFTGSFGVINDITEIRKSEEALRESEYKFRSLIEQAGDGFELLDSQGRYVDVNETTCRMLGYSRDEMLDLSIPDIDPLTDLSKYVSDFKSLINNPPATFETVHRRRDGSEFPVEVTASIIKIGKNYFAQTLVRDITRRKETEKALYESEEKFRSLSESTMEGIAIIQDGKIIAANKRACEMFGYRSDEIVGMSPLDFSAPESREIVLKNIQEGNENPYEITEIRKDGSKFIAEVCGKPIIFKGRQARVTAIRDITESKQAEADLRKSQVFQNSIFNSAPT